MKAARILVLAVVPLVLAAAAYTLYWFVTANHLQAGLDKWAAARRAEGYSLAWREETVGGFPFAFRIALTDATIARGNSYRVAVPLAVGVASPTDLSHWTVSAAKGGTGTVQGIDTVITAASLSGAVNLAADATTFDVSVLRLSGDGAVAGQMVALVTLPRKPPQNHRELGLAASIRIFHLTLPQAVTALGNTIENLTVASRVMGELPAGQWRPALAAWRDDGGTIEVPHAELEWGALHLETSGTLALDANLQPTCAMTASIVDHAALIDAAVAAGVMPRRNAGVVKLVLDLLAKREPDGQTRLTAPVTVQDGRASIGRAEIGRVPRIDWR